MQDIVSNLAIVGSLLAAHPIVQGFAAIVALLVALYVLVRVIIALVALVTWFIVSLIAVGDHSAAMALAESSVKFLSQAVNPRLAVGICVVASLAAIILTVRWIIKLREKSWVEIAGEASLLVGLTLAIGYFSVFDRLLLRWLGA